jgi:hypothetical protein
MSFLDLLGTVVNPELTYSEVARVRSMLSSAGSTADTPWPSGIAERVVTPQERENAYLRERIAELELAVKLLCDVLTEGRLLEPNGLATRIAAVKAQLAEQQRQMELQAQENIEAARRAAEERTVACSACGAVVRQRASFMSAGGPLCQACHERSTP